MKYFIYAIIIAAVLVGGWFLADSQGWIGTTATSTQEMATTSPWDMVDEQSGETQTASSTGTTTTSTATSSTATSSAASAAVKTFTVEGKNFSFSPAAITVKKGDTVKIIFKNSGGTHDWVLDEFNAKTQKIGSGESETIEFVADKAGTFEYYCSVGNHRAMGMKGTLTVTP